MHNRNLFPQVRTLTIQSELVYKYPRENVLKNCMDRSFPNLAKLIIYCRCRNGYDLLDDIRDFIKSGFNLNSKTVIFVYINELDIILCQWFYGSKRELNLKRSYFERNELVIENDNYHESNHMQDLCDALKLPHDNTFRLSTRGYTFKKSSITNLE